jgi:dolichol kinase
VALLIGAAAAAVTELFTLRVDDNFTVPIGSGLAMVAARWLL